MRKVGLDKVMWGSDYPHHESTYPYTTEGLRLAFSDWDPDEVRQVTSRTAAEVYDFDLAALAPIAARVGPRVDEVALPLDEVPADSGSPAFTQLGEHRPVESRSSPRGSRRRPTSTSRRCWRRSRDAGLAPEAACWDDPDVDWSRFRLAVLRSPWDYVPRYAEFLAWLARVERLTTVLNPPDVVRWSTDKRYLRDLARPRRPGRARPTFHEPDAPPPGLEHLVVAARRRGRRREAGRVRRVEGHDAALVERRRARAHPRAARGRTRGDGPAVPGRGGRRRRDRPRLLRR